MGNGGGFGGGAIAGVVRISILLEWSRRVGKKGGATALGKTSVVQPVPAFPKPQSM
jgi:hypothetical protein